jgi:hypothetical protein
MAYIPVVPHTPSPPPSPRTRELAGLLTKVLEEYKKSHPATSDAEIRAAVRLAQLSSRSGNQALPAAVSLGVGLLAAGVAAGIVFFRAGAGGEMESGFPMIVMAVAVFLAIVFVLVKVASR